MRISNWFGDVAVPQIDPEARAIAAWQRIQDRPSEVILNREGSPLAAQTMRIEMVARRDTLVGPAGQTLVLPVRLFGVRGHPTVSDTNLQRLDRFALNGLIYEVQSVVEYAGEVQALAAAYG